MRFSNEFIFNLVYKNYLNIGLEQRMLVFAGQLRFKFMFKFLGYWLYNGAPLPTSGVKSFSSYFSHLLQGIFRESLE